jgi:hypothetical protein
MPFLNDAQAEALWIVRDEPGVQVDRRRLRALKRRHLIEVVSGRWVVTLAGAVYLLGREDGLAAHRRAAIAVRREEAARAV